MPGNQQIWVRPSPCVSEDVLLALVGNRGMTASPRLGGRSPGDAKGYVGGETIALRVLDAEHNDLLPPRRVRVERVFEKRFCELTSGDLRRTSVYRNWRDVQSDLAFFYQRAIDERDTVSIVEFSYL